MTETIDKECPKHGLTVHVKDTQGYFRCRKCRVEAVDRKRKKNKQALVDLLGGKCQICNYKKCLRALEFHHLNPKEKSFTISFEGMARSLEKLAKEAKKCMLVCSNCHREIEDGLVAHD